MKKRGGFIMKVSMILNYALRKEMWLLDAGDRYKNDLGSIKQGIQKIMEEYIKTENGKKYFEANNKKIFLCHFVDIINDIPDEILDRYEIHPSSGSKADFVIAFSATDVLIDIPTCAVFGKYDEEYPLSKYQIDRLLKSVNLYDDIYLFRPLLSENGNLVGIGFVSDEVLDDAGFSLQEFLKAAAKTVSATSEVQDNEIHENQGHFYKLIDLRF